jgi:hypothetical protein
VVHPSVMSVMATTMPAMPTATVPSMSAMATHQVQMELEFVVVIWIVKDTLGYSH